MRYEVVVASTLLALYGGTILRTMRYVRATAGDRPPQHRLMVKIIVTLGVAAVLSAMSSPANAGDWSVIDCAQSKLMASGFPDAECKRGPDVGSISCLSEQFMVTSKKSDFILHLAILPARNCFLQRPSDDNAEIRQFFTGLPTTAGWGEIHDIAGATGAYVTGGSDNCFSFYKPGPSRIGSEGGGVVWILHGLFCSGAGGLLDDQVVAALISAIEIQQ